MSTKSQSIDIFIYYDGKPVSDIYSFIEYRNAEAPDSPPKELQVLRDGNILKFMISHGKIGAEITDSIQS